MAETDEESELLAKRDVLVAANLTVADPEALSGLIYPLPPAATLEEVTVDYDTQRTTGKKVRCAACPHHQHHYRGFVVRIAEGGFALIGINCGEKHFGEGVWGAATARLRRLQDEAYYETRVVPAIQLIERVRPPLKAWRHSYRTFCQFKADLERRFRDLATALRVAASQHDGRLEVESFSRRVKVDRDGRQHEKFERQAKRIGRIPFPQAFVASGERHIARALRSVEEASKLLSASPGLSETTTALRHLRDARAEVDQAAEYHEGWLANLALDWWSVCCRWFNEDQGGALRLRDRLLFEVEYDEFGLNIPDPHTVPCPAETVRAAWAIS